MFDGLAERFWSKVNKVGPVPEHCSRLGACWIWEASKNRGYGRFKVSGKQEIAHRIAWLLEHGTLPEKLACHHCDNPSCVRPSHLFDGTQKENMVDAMRKGRVTSTLSRKQALAIRRSSKPPRVLARRYGVSVRQIGRIRDGISWKTDGS